MSEDKQRTVFDHKYPEFESKAQTEIPGQLPKI